MVLPIAQLIQFSRPAFIQPEGQPKCQAMKQGRSIILGPSMPCSCREDSPTRQVPPRRGAGTCSPLLAVLLLFSSGGLSEALGAAAPAEDSDRLPFRHIIIDRDFPRYPHCKAVGDINRDGLPDVLVASALGEGLFWYAYPDWTKHRIDTGTFSTDMQVGDVNGDGYLDVIIPRAGTGLVWYENPLPDGDPAVVPWARHRIDSEGGHDVEVGDVNGDGLLDVVVRDRETRVFLQEPNADSWRKIVVATGGRGGTVLGDIDGDGDLDIAQNGYWLENSGDPEREWSRHEIASGWPDDVGVHLEDINGDGALNVLLAPGETSGRLVWYETNDPKKGPWSEHVIADDVSHVHTFKTADVNRNGAVDVVIAEMEQSPLRRVSIYYNQNQGRNWRQQVVGRTGAHNLRVADIGNDGDIDIIGTNHGNYGGDSPVDLWENLSNDHTPVLPLDRWERHVIDPERPGRATFALAGDLDGDGLKDIVSGGFWYRNPGKAGGGWKRESFGPLLQDVALVADLTGNGHPDVLGTQHRPVPILKPDVRPRFSWEQNHGGGQFTIHTNIEPAEGDFLQGIARIFTGYRKMAIALSWHRGGQGIQLLSVPKDPVAEMWSWHRIADISQDEQLSVGTISPPNPDLLLGTKWIERNGDRWTVHTLNPTEGSPDRNRLADMNGDGRLDAVVGFEAINIPGKLAWYEQPKEPTDTWVEHIIGWPVGPMSLDVADLDRDGDFDVVVGEHNYREPATARLIVFENLDGAGQKWKEHLVHQGDEHHDGAVLADIDNDGDLDIISIGWTHGKVVLYENKAINR